MYQAQITSRISQFGYTEVYARLVDNAEVMPTRIVSYTWPKMTITNADLIAARDILIANAVQEYQDSLKAAADMQAFRNKAKDWLDNKIAQAQQDYLDLVQNSDLTEDQKALAMRVKFDWRLE